MAEAAQAAGGNDANGQQQGQGSIFQRLLQMFLWYQIISWGMKSFMKQPSSTVNESGEKNDDSARIMKNDDSMNYGISDAMSVIWQSGEMTTNYAFHSQENHRNYWTPDTEYNLRVYVSKELDFFNSENFDENDLISTFDNLLYKNDDSMYREFELNITLTPQLQNNGTLYAHIILHKSGYPYLESDKDFDYESVIYDTHALVKYKKLPKIKKKQNLLFSNDNNDDENEQEPNESDETVSCSESESDHSRGMTEKECKDIKEGVIIGHFRPELTIRPLCDWTSFKVGQIPPQIKDFYKIDLINNRYWPIIYFDDFWLFQDKLIALNETVTQVPLKIMHNPISQWKFMIQVSMAQQYKQQNEWGLSGGLDSSDPDAAQDDMKRLLIESNPYLLAITFLVTILHSLFDFLAFKNDVQFWRKKDSTRGISVRSVFLNAFFQSVIFLYLFDSGETSYMILVSSGIGVLIEYWKITQACNVTYGFGKIEKFNGLYGISLPWINFENKTDYIESDTEKYDKEAMTYLSYVAFPLLLGYTIYSLIYYEHRGWYSFILKTLVSYIYMFGFIMMCPQLYLNYKLHSVAHLPWRMLTYKFLNTIIDDLFAFLITMPWLHRLSCFRDDLVFVIFLYQKWIYPTDYTRTNEYGFTPVQDPNDGENNGAIKDASNDKKTEEASKEEEKENSLRQRKGSTKTNGKTEKQSKEHKDEIGVTKKSQKKKEAASGAANGAANGGTEKDEHSSDSNSSYQMVTSETDSDSANAKDKAKQLKKDE